MRCQFDATCGDIAGNIIYERTGVKSGERCHQCKDIFIKSWREQGYIWKPYRCSEPGCRDAPTGYAGSTISIALVVPQCEYHHQRDWRNWPCDMYWTAYPAMADVVMPEKEPTRGKPLCRCPMTDLMRYGCKCGGR